MSQFGAAKARLVLAAPHRLDAETAIRFAPDAGTGGVEDYTFTYLSRQRGNRAGDTQAGCEEDRADARGLIVPEPAAPTSFVRCASGRGAGRQRSSVVFLRKHYPRRLNKSKVSRHVH